PRLSKMIAAGDGAAIAAQYHRFAQLLAIGILPPALLLCVFSERILLLWTADAVTARTAGPLLSVWVAGTALNGLMHIPYAAQLAHGWPRLAALLNAVAVVIMVPAVLVLVPAFGAVAAAWIWVSINAVYVTVGIGLMHQRILKGEKWAWYLHDVLGPFACCALAAGLAAAVHLGAGPMSRWAEVAFFAICLLVLAIAAAAGSPLGRWALRFPV